MLLSYLTTHRGRASDLARCINSVKVDLNAAGIVDYEHLVFIDGYCDDWSVFESLNSTHVRFIYTYNNHGKGYGVNRLIDYSKGKYLFFLDSDDWNLKGRTLKQLKLLQTSDSCIFGSNYLGWDGASHFFESNYPQTNDAVKIEFWRFPFLLYSSMSVKKEDLINNRLFFREDLKGGIDYEFYSRAFMQLGVQNCEDTLVVYTVGSLNGITNNEETRNEQLLTHMTTMASLLGLSVNEHSHLVRYLFSFIICDPSCRHDAGTNSLRLEFLRMLKDNRIGTAYFPKDISNTSLVAYFERFLEN